VEEFGDVVRKDGEIIYIEGIDITKRKETEKLYNKRRTLRLLIAKSEFWLI
jgi:hypothetical protein